MYGSYFCVIAYVCYQPQQNHVSTAWRLKIDCADAMGMSEVSSDACASTMQQRCILACQTDLCSNACKTRAGKLSSWKSKLTFPAALAACDVVSYTQAYTHRCTHRSARMNVQ
jgi:hypothetical protein